ncbi:type II toxin-antitoxin system RelE/ParE family toxin [Niabella aquatica]
MDAIREIIFYKKYFEDFFETLPQKVKDKIDEVLFMITIIERIPAKFFKSIEGIKGLFESRVEYESNIYRIFCCFDRGNLVVLFNGFQKKAQKTPAKELEKAEKIMKEYLAHQQAGFDEQKGNNNESKK